ncbi:DUF2523 family protein [Variovorax sp. LT1R16]|uniref:DUF2523 family protein n=1 Tax=Variovorax sp. LT1R16 TaxID=3443728 RepID=UPI003F480D20
MKFGTFLIGLVEPILAKLLMALGFSVVSIVGVDAALNTVKGMIVSNLSGLGGIIDFALYLWLGKALGVIFGACATKLMLWNIQNATKILGKSNG